MAPGKFEWNFRHVIFKQILVIDGWGISCEIALIWLSLDLTHDQSTLVQVMVWCPQATSHYLSQRWSRALLPYGVTRPQWVNKVCFLSVCNVWFCKTIPSGPNTGLTKWDDWGEYVQSFAWYHSLGSEGVLPAERSIFCCNLALRFSSTSSPTLENKKDFTVRPKILGHISI